MEEACWRALASKPAALASQPPYDLKLPNATAGVKRTAEQWAVRESKAAAAKVSKLMAQYEAAKAEHAAASGAAERKNQRCLDAYAASRGDFSKEAQRRTERLHATSDASDARRDAACAAQIEVGEAVVDALKDQMALQDQAAVALAAEEPAEEGSDMDELDWEWDVLGVVHRRQKSATSFNTFCVVWRWRRQGLRAVRTAHVCSSAARRSL